MQPHGWIMCTIRPWCWSSYRCFINSSPSSTYTSMSCCLTHVLDMKIICLQRDNDSFVLRAAALWWFAICCIVFSSRQDICPIVNSSSRILFSFSLPLMMDKNAIPSINRYCRLFWFRGEKIEKWEPCSSENVTFNGEGMKCWSTFEADDK